MARPAVDPEGFGYLETHGWIDGPEPPDQDEFMTISELLAPDKQQ